MSIKLQDFMCFLHEKKLIDLDSLLRNNEIGCINRLKLQKYVYLAQTCLGNDFGYKYTMYNNGPYSPELANYYYEKIDVNTMSVDVKAKNWNYDKNFANKFLELFGDKEPQWLEVASTIIDSINYFEDEQETLNKVYAIKSDYSRNYIDDVWNELKDKNLVQYKTGLKLNNRLSVF
jgi:uncharacterized protein YwgA